MCYIITDVHHMCDAIIIIYDERSLISQNDFATTDKWCVPYHSCQITKVKLRSLLG